MPPAADAKTAAPRTPDGRYFVVRGRLWRTTNPSLTERERDRLVRQLMRARRDIAHGNKTRDTSLLADARHRVHLAKLALGERGPVWWDDGVPDYNRRLVNNTPYLDWFQSLPEPGH